MLPKELTTNQLEAQLQVLAEKIARAKDLNMRIAELGEDLAELQTEHRTLVGGLYRRGEIAEVKATIANIELKISHESKPKVVWINEPENWGMVK